MLNNYSEGLGLGSDKATTQNELEVARAAETLWLKKLERNKSNLITELEKLGVKNFDRWLTRAEDLIKEAMKKGNGLAGMLFGSQDYIFAFGYILRSLLGDLGSVTIFSTYRVEEGLLKVQFEGGVFRLVTEETKFVNAANTIDKAGLGFDSGGIGGKFYFQFKNNTTSER